MVFDTENANHLKPWLVRTLEPMYAFLQILFVVNPYILTMDSADAMLNRELSQIIY